MPQPPDTETVFVIDFGAQYTQLIARRIRECHVFCEIVPATTSAQEISCRQPKGIVLSGGPASVYETDAPHADIGIYQLGVPILGICYGHQLMSYQLGGVVEPSARREYGRTELTVLQPEDPLFAGLGTHLTCWMSHGDKVLQPPPGFRTTAVTESTPVAAMADPARRFYGVQFHPEVHHTPFGKQLIDRFLKQVCRCKGDWTPGNFVEQAIHEIRQQVGNGHVLVAVSGGVDSMTVAALVHRAIGGERLTCVFVDHGLLRAGEAEQVRETFSRLFPVHLVYVDARQRFLERLQGVEDPEQKRKVIGETFVRVFEEHADELRNCEYLAQGTLYPDVIESGATKHSATIKTHHNVGGLPPDMRLKVIEPLRYLFKDEVRAVAAELGLPDEVVWRQPFPGPGLAVRIAGEVTPERLEIVRAADKIVLEEIWRAGLMREIWQSFAVLPAVRSVGVMGDQRTYAHPIVVRAVVSEDAMTADWARLPHEVLERISNRIVGEVPGVNRVLYDITSKPPATIEWE
jgi:GMP synthase (glutamine-hydrolysing)